MGMPERTTFLCERESDKMKFSLKLPQSFVDQHHQLGLVKPTMSFMVDSSSLEATVVRRTSNVLLEPRYPSSRVPPIADSTLPIPRSVYKTIGARKILAVRATSLDSQPTNPRVFIGSPRFGFWASGQLLYYWKAGDRIDDSEVKLAANDDDTENEIFIQGS
jgi:hypothetical protein